MINEAEILSMKESSELFYGEEKEIKEQYIQLIKYYHPDVNNQSLESLLLTSKINIFYQKALKDRKNGIWEEKDDLVLIGIDKKHHYMKYQIKHSFEMGTFYIGRQSVLYLFYKDYLDFAQNMLTVISNFKYENAAMEEEFSLYLPKLITTFRCKNGEFCILAEKGSDFYCLEDILSYYRGVLSAKQTAWILSSLYNLVCFIFYNQLAHNDITIKNYFISPSKHSGLLLGGWWYTRGLNQKLLGAEKQIYEIMSREMKEEKRSQIQLDLEAIRMIGRILLGDKTGVTLVLNKDIPAPFVQWLRESAGNNPFIEYKQWNKVIKASFGGNYFTPMKIEERNFYQMIEKN